MFSDLGCSSTMTQHEITEKYDSHKEDCSQIFTAGVQRILSEDAEIDVSVGILCER